jgi:small-conductance mechanosensitive channel
MLILILNDPISNLGEWIISNLYNILFSIIIIVVGYIIYRFVTKQVTKLSEEKKLSQHISYTLNRFLKWIAFIIILSSVLGQFGIAIGTISGIVTLIGGTVLGFASINTLGNTIAGLIVMISRPFGVGDRIYFKNQFLDVEGIEVIYTKMRTLDNVIISIPNQELLKSEIENYGKKTTIRRQITVTPGYNYSSQEVKKVLLEASEQVQPILKIPPPYVRITKFLDYAVEYTLYVYINNVKRIREIDSELYETVLETCNKHKIDISTPLLLQQIK